MRLPLAIATVILLLAGCAASPPIAEQAPDGPIYGGPGSDGSPPKPGPALANGVWYSCDNMTAPESWYGHEDGSLWCVMESGLGTASGTLVLPTIPLRNAYTGWNGSVGHAVGDDVEGNVYVMCWNAVCLVDITMVIAADGVTVTTLRLTDVLVDVPLLGGVWLTLTGALDQAVPRGAILSMDVAVDGVGVAMLRGDSGAQASHFTLGK